MSEVKSSLRTLLAFFSGVLFTCGWGFAAMNINAVEGSTAWWFVFPFFSTIGFILFALTYMDTQQLDDMFFNGERIDLIDMISAVSGGKRLFLLVVAFLLLAPIVLSIFFVLRNPTDPSGTQSVVSTSLLAMSAGLFSLGNKK